jgi:hypothetical protein
MDEDLLDVARTIRPYLEELVGAEAAFYDQEIARLLAAAHAGADVDERLTVVLSRSTATHAWAAKTLEDELHRPPHLQPVRELGFEHLPGKESPTATDKYCCPERDFVWWRRSVAKPVPPCPYDGSTLVACT